MRSYEEKAQMAHLLEFLPELLGEQLETEFALYKVAEVDTEHWSVRMNIVASKELPPHYGPPNSFEFPLRLPFLQESWLVYPVPDEPSMACFDFQPVLLRIQSRHLMSYLVVLAPVLPPDLIRYLRRAL